MVKFEELKNIKLIPIFQTNFLQDEPGQFEDKIKSTIDYYTMK